MRYRVTIAFDLEAPAEMKDLIGPAIKKDWCLVNMSTAPLVLPLGPRGGYKETRASEVTVRVREEK